MTIASKRISTIKKKKRKKKRDGRKNIETS